MDAVAGREGELDLAVLSGRPAAASLTVERVSAATGTPLGVAYRSVAYGTEGLPDAVGLTPDASGQFLLVGYDGWTGIVSGWIDQGNLRHLPLEHPEPVLLFAAW